jgi:hypothetical protein
MSETPITQQAEAAVTRINQLTERMITAARNAGGGLADAHEKALRSLVDNPAGILVELEGSDRPACVIETVVIYR